MAFLHGGGLDGIRDWDAEAVGLAQAAFTHAWGVVELMADDQTLLLPAAAAARASWEAALVCTWILEDAVEEVRMQRWLGYRMKHAKYFRVMALEFDRKNVGRTDEAATAAANYSRQAKDRAAEIEQGVAETSQNFAAKGVDAEVIHLPNIEEMAIKVGRQKQYYMYRELSQFVHANPHVLQFVLETTAFAEGAQPGHVQLRHKVPAHSWAAAYACAGEAVMMAAEAIGKRTSRQTEVKATVEPAWGTFVAQMGSLFTGTDAT